MDYTRFLQDYRNWLILMGGFVSVVYLAMPCFIKYTLRFRRHFSLDEVDPAELPSQVAAFFHLSAEQMEPIGFRAVRHFLISDLLPNVTAVIVVFENRVQDEVAIAAVMFAYKDSSGKKEVLLQEKYVEFSTEFINDTEISTNNNRQESAFKPVSRRRIMQFPDTEDISTLYSAHQLLLQRFATQPKRTLPHPEQWAEEIRNNMTRELLEQIETGYLKTDASQEFFLATWKGAYLMTWKLMLPIAQIRRWNRRRKARHLLSEIVPA